MNVSKTGDNPKRYVLDTSALLAYSSDEPGADMVGALLLKARHGGVELYCSFMTAMEIGYQAFRAKGKDGLVQVTAYLQELPVRRVDVSDELIALAAQLKGSAQLSVADAWILATAQYLTATLVHKDPEFEQARPAIQLHALPYRSG